MELSSQQFLILCIACAAGIAIAWSVPFIALRRQPDAIGKLLSEGTALRLIAVVFIVTAATVAAFANKLEPELSTIFSGIAGFVLGGLKSSTQPASNL